MTQQPEKFIIEIHKPFSTFTEGRPTPIPHIIDGLCPYAAFSVLGGKAKHGKSSMSRCESVCIAKGQPFLGRPTEQSEVLLCSLEDPRQHVDNCLEALGYDLDDEPDYPGGVLFHGNTFEIFPAGALGPFRIEHSGQVIRRIAAFDPIGQEVLSEVQELLIDPMSERLAFGRIRGKRSNLFDYCERSKWIADAGVPAHANN